MRDERGRAGGAMSRLRGRARQSLGGRLAWPPLPGPTAISCA